MGDTSFGVSDNSDVIILIYFSTYTSRNYHVSEFVIFALKTVLSKYIYFRLRTQFWGFALKEPFY